MVFMSEFTADLQSHALEGILLRFRRRVRQAGFGRGLAEHDLEDLEQEVRIRLWKAEERGENLSALPASYVYKVATTAAVDLMRRRRTGHGDRTATLEDAEAVGQMPTAADQPDRVLDRADLGASIDEALQALPPKREPIVRMYLAGYSREEIASLMHWTEAKTRNLLYRGLDNLRTELIQRGVVVAP